MYQLTLLPSKYKCFDAKVCAIFIEYATKMKKDKN